MMDKRVEAVARSLGEYVYERNGNPLKWDDMNDSKQEVARCYARCALKAADAAAWQPIESAPRDGTRIFAFGDGYMFILFFVEGIDKWYCDTNEIFYDTDELTHWQPLPAPPSDATEGER